MLEKIWKKKVEEQISKFSIEFFFEQKNRNFRAKKRDFPPKFSIEKNILKIRKIIGKCVKKSKFLGNFPKIFRFFSPPFRIFFGVYLVSFLNQNFRKFSKKSRKNFEIFDLKNLPNKPQKIFEKVVKKIENF